MYIRVAKSGALALEEIDNFRAFSIRLSDPGADLSVLAEIGEAAEDEHYWLDADAVQRLSAQAGDPQWVRDYRAMLEQVAPYGYFDTSTNRVKAHVETASGEQ